MSHTKIVMGGDGDIPTIPYFTRATKRKLKAEEQALYKLDNSPFSPETPNIRAAIPGASKIPVEVTNVNPNPTINLKDSAKYFQLKDIYTPIHMLIVEVQRLVDLVSGSTNLIQNNEITPDANSMQCDIEDTVSNVWCMRTDSTNFTQRFYSAVSNHPIFKKYDIIKKIQNDYTFFSQVAESTTTQHNKNIHNVRDKLIRILYPEDKPDLLKGEKLTMSTTNVKPCGTIVSLTSDVPPMYNVSWDYRDKIPTTSKFLQTPCKIGANIEYVGDGMTKKGVITECKDKNKYIHFRFNSTINYETAVQKLECANNMRGTLEYQRPEQQMNEVWGTSVTQFAKGNDANDPVKCYICKGKIVNKPFPEMEHKMYALQIFTSVPYIINTTLTTSDKPFYQAWKEYTATKIGINGLKELYVRLNFEPFNDYVRHKTRIEQQYTYVMKTFDEYINTDLITKENQPSYEYCKQVVKLWLLAFAYAHNRCNGKKSNSDWLNHFDIQQLDYIVDVVKKPTTIAKQESHKTKKQKTTKRGGATAKNRSKSKTAKNQSRSKTANPAQSKSRVKQSMKSTRAKLESEYDIIMDKLGTLDKRKSAEQDLTNHFKYIKENLTELYEKYEKVTSLIETDNAKLIFAVMLKNLRKALDKRNVRRMDTKFSQRQTKKRKTETNRSM